MPDQHLIANEWRDARSGATDEIVNPATDAVIGTAPASAAADVDDAVRAAAAAFPTGLPTLRCKELSSHTPHTGRGCG